MFFIFLVGGSNLLQLLQFQLLAISLTYLSKLGVTMLLQLCDKVLQNFPNSEKRSYYVY